MIKMRTVVIILLLLSVSLLSRAEAKSGSDYTIINTGIKAGGCWYDDSHFIVVQGQQPAPGQEFEVEGLYYLDPNKPKDLRRIDLSPIDLSLQKNIQTVSCQEQTILFYLRSGESGLQQLYGLKIGAQPELIAEMRGGSVNLAGHYVISKFRRTSTVEGQGLQGIGIYEAHPDCGVKYVKPGFKTLCLDTWMESGRSGSHYRVVEYTWYETIKVRDKSGQEKWVPNPEPPLKLADGTELKHGYLLRDLEDRIVTQVKMEQPPYQIYRNTLKPDPQGGSLYSVCSKAGDHGARRLTVGGRICRFKVDGANQRWEEKVALQQSPQDPFSLHGLDVNEQGDVVAMELGHRGASSLWKYSARTQQVEKVRQAPTIADLGAPRLSPTGQWISFVERQTLYLAQDKGVRP